MDPGSRDLQPSSLNLNPVDEEKMYFGSCEDHYKQSHLDDHFFHRVNCGSESEFYTNSGISSAPLPNDEIWGKFDILDAAEGCDFEGDLEELNSLAWMNPLSSQIVGKDARQIRNHDCMWAGYCISEKHVRNNEKNQKCGNNLLIKEPHKTNEAEVVTVTMADGTVTTDGNKICVRKKAAVVPTHARSILLPTRIVNESEKKTVGATMRVNKSKTLDSEGESPRPETPRNFVCDISNGAGKEDPNCYESGNYSDAYMLDRIQKGEMSKNATKAGESRGAGANGTNRTTVRHEVPVSRNYTSHSYFSDHCYHLNNNARMDNFGVQTQSDSEEKIDMETVCGDNKKPNCRSSSSGSVVPTNPSLSDRHQLQLTVSTATNKKYVKKLSARTFSVPPCSRALKSKLISCKRKINARAEVKWTSGGNKRVAQLDEYKYANKSRSAVGDSSDSEVDSIERRTIRNSMERQRRIHLRNGLEHLRKLIPYLEDNEKASQVMILNYGAELCKTLTAKDAELTKKKAELQRQQEMLMARVSQLRRSLAAQR